MNELQELLREQRVLIALLRAIARNTRALNRRPVDKKLGMQRLLLLRIAEGLIEAHKAAKIDDNGLTLDLIEDALCHVGERLAAETGDGRNFCHKKLGPV